MTRSRVAPMVSVVTLAVVVMMVLLAVGARSAGAQHPDESHCGTETGGGPLSGFLSHEQVGEALRQIERTSRGRVEVEVAGHTNLGREIWAARVGHGDQVVLVQSAIHGNEQHGTRGLLNLVATIGGSSSRAARIREAVTFVAIPNLNADGAAIPRRQNVMPWSDVMALHPQLADQPRVQSRPRLRAQLGGSAGHQHREGLLHHAGGPHGARGVSRTGGRVRPR
jgi:hypothetical protein